MSLFKKQNKTYLLPAEVEDLKRYRSNTIINEIQFQEYIKFITDGGKKITLDDKVNRTTVFQLIEKYYLKTFYKQKGYELITRRLNDTMANLPDIIFETIEVLAPELDKIRKYG